MSSETRMIALRSMRSELAAFDIEIRERNASDRAAGIAMEVYRQKLVAAIREIEASK